jgi:dienelactone hydrolase
LRRLVKDARFRTVVFLLPLALAPVGLRAESQDVAIAAADGLVLRGSYFPAGSPGPGVLLLHQCNRDRESYEPLARRLADAGFHVLTFDFRGFGESVGGSVRDFRSQHEELWPSFDEDVDDALAFLTDLPGVDGERIGALGASCGGSQVLLLANRHPGVKAVVFLSSSLPCARAIPILGIAAEEDTRTAERTERVFRRSKHPDTRLLLYKGNLHGVPLFEHDPDLAQSLTAWFSDHL